MFLFLLFACATENNQDVVERPSFDDDLRAAIALDIEATGATAFAMAVIKNDAVIWSDGFGDHTKNGTEVTADTLFRVASLTKPMTALSVLQQVQNGCLELNAPVDQYMTDFVINKQSELSSTLSVADTLRMTGGLFDYQVQTGDDGDGKIEEFLPYYLSGGVFLSPPGRMYNYSNTNYIVAGRLVELCTESYFRANMEAAVWGPLGMDSTTFSTANVVADGEYAMGVTTHWPDRPGEDVVVDAESFAASQLWPAMGAWSSVNDLAKLGLFLMNGNSDVLSTELFETMTRMQVDTEEGYPAKGYGFGVKIKTGIKMGKEHYPVTMLSHLGSVYGSSAHMYLIPELDVGVVAIINRDNASPINSVPLALDLASLSTPQEVTYDLPTEFSEYQGTFYNEFHIGRFNLTADESGLSVEIPALDQAGIGYTARLEPVRPDNFLLYYPDGTFDLLSFIRDSDEEVEYIRHRNYVGKRVDGASLTAEDTPPFRSWGSWVSSESRMSVFD